MKIFIAIVGLSFCALLSGCELLCQAGTGTCGLSREQTEKLLHPKAYRDYWVKPDMTVEGRQREWMACGGEKNGNFSPYQSDIESMVASGMSREQARKTLNDKLSTCLQSKGYEYQRESKSP